MPFIFLEGYQSLLLKANKLKWPIHPKAIFTSQAHFTDDVFKSWAATKVSSGIPLIVGEHGGLGVGLLNGAHRYEVSIADLYLTSGWSSKIDSSIRPLGHLKKYSKPSTAPCSKALMICCNMPRFSFDIRSMAISSQILDYFDDQFKLIQSLPSHKK